MDERMITTKNGDGGQSSLLYGGRLYKNHQIFEAVGSIDELNSAIGLSIKFDGNSPKERDILIEIQNRLVILMGEISCNDRKTYLEKRDFIDQIDLKLLDGWCAEYDTGEYQGWSTPQSHLDHAVRICRRAERQLISLRLFEEESWGVANSSVLLSEFNQVPEEVLYLEGNTKIRAFLVGYINRLSDVLWLIARKL